MKEICPHSAITVCDDSLKIFTWDFFNSTSVPSLTMVMINGPRGNTNGPMDPNAYKRVG